MISAGDWLFSLVTTRYPALKIVLAESGIGWVPMLMDRLEHMDRTGADAPDTKELWRQLGDPVEALQRNFYFTTFEDRTSFRLLDRIGEDNVMLEVDYPHPDSSWPNTHDLLAPQLSGLSTEVIHKLAYDTAARVYRYPGRSQQYQRLPAASPWSAPGSGPETRRLSGCENADDDYNRWQPAPAHKRGCRQAGRRVAGDGQQHP
jgi:hypothetical protein